MMKTYHFYLTEDFIVTASVDEVADEFLIGSVEMELSDFPDLHVLIQGAVDATLCQLDAKRRSIVNMKTDKSLN